LIRRLLVPLALLVTASCTAKLPDPPVVAQSQELPLAPPGARGAHAGTLDPAPLPKAKLWDDPEEPAEEAPAADGGATESDPDGGGVTL